MPTRDRHEFFDCSCSDNNHLLRIDIYEWGNENPVEVDLCISTQLNHYLPFWKRISMAFKYVLGKSAGEWYSTTLVNKEDVERLKSIIQDFETRQSQLTQDINKKGN
jgi:hypothetical protein